METPPFLTYLEFVSQAHYHIQLNFLSQQEMKSLPLLYMHLKLASYAPYHIHFNL